MTDQELHAIDAYWRAANYLTVGQIYLSSNALLREPMDAIRRARRPLPDAAELTAACQEVLAKHKADIVEHFDDMPEIRDWTWGAR